MYKRWSGRKLAAATCAVSLGREGEARAVFLDFFFALRAHEVAVSPLEWLALMEALSKKLHNDNLEDFYLRMMIMGWMCRLEGK